MSSRIRHAGLTLENGTASAQLLSMDMLPRADRPIYLDYHATTPVDPRVIEVVVHYMTNVFGNASSTDHIFGDEAAAVVETARREVASLVGAAPGQVIFTSGATESLRLALSGLALRVGGRGKALRIAHTPVEHRAVLDTCMALAAAGAASLRALRVDAGGRLDLDDLETACRSGQDVVCVMAANNEIGTIYPVEEVSKIAKRHGALVLSDATQAVGKVPLSFDAWNIDMLALTGHKFYGPKGVGALILSSDHLLEPDPQGGPQRGLRSGTLNVPGIAGLGEACRLRAVEMVNDERRVARQRNSLQQLLCDSIGDLCVNGAPEARLSGNLHVSIPVPNTAVIARVRHRLALSTGAACSSGIEAPSHVLRAIGLPARLQDGALRLGLGKFTTDEDIRDAATLLSAATEHVRAAI